MDVQELEKHVDKLRADTIRLFQDFKTKTGYSVGDIRPITVTSMGHPEEVVHVHLTVAYNGESTFTK